MRRNYSNKMMSPEFVCNGCRCWLGGVGCVDGKDYKQCAKKPDKTKYSTKDRPTKR